METATVKRSVIPTVAITAVATVVIVFGLVWAYLSFGNAKVSIASVNAAPSSALAGTTLFPTPVSIHTSSDKTIAAVMPAQNIPGGISQFISADGSLNVTDLQKSTSWDILKGIVTYAINGYSRSTKTAFQTEGSLDNESYIKSMNQIDTAETIENQVVYTSQTPPVGATYSFTNQKIYGTPDSIKAILNQFNDAVDGKLGVPVCPTMDNTCVFQKTLTVKYDPAAFQTGEGALNITFDLNPVNKTASLPFFTTVHADQGMQHYQVVATILNNGLLADLKFQIVGNNVGGTNTSWYTVGSFVYTY